jgi:phage FluMu gp28-like protein
MDDGVPFVRPGYLHRYGERIFDNRKRYQVIKKPRRVGGTFTVLGSVVHTLVQPFRLDAYFFSHTERGGILSMADVEYWGDYYDTAAMLAGLPSIWAGGNKKTALTKTSASFASGNRLEIMPGNPRNVRGQPGPTWYIFDELAFHLDPEGMIAAAGPILALASSRVTFLSTVLYEDPFWELCEKTRREQDEDAGKDLFEFTFDDALDDGFYEREVAKLVWSGAAYDPDEWAVDDAELAAYLGVSHRPGARAEYRRRTFAYSTEPDREFLCIPSRSSDRYIPLEWIRQCKDVDCEVFRFPAPKNFFSEPESVREATIKDFMAGVGRSLERWARNPPRQWYYGIDYGRVRDLTVMTFGFVDDGVLRAVFVLELEDLSDDDQIIFFDQCVARIERRNLHRGANDMGGNGRGLWDKVRRRIGDMAAEGVSFTEEWNSTHWQNTRQRFHDRRIRIPDDQRIEQDLGQVKRINGVPKIPKASRTRMSPSLDGSGGFRHGDAAVSIVLLDYAARDAVVPANTGPGKHTRVGTSNRRAAMRQ